MKRLIKAVTWVLLTMFMLTSLTGCDMIKEYTDNLLGCVSDPTWNPIPHVEEPTPAPTPVPAPTAAPTPTPEPPAPEPPTPTPVPTEPPTPVPTDTPTPTSFLFGGVEVYTGQTTLQVKGKREALIRITPEEMDLLVKLCPNLTSMELCYCCMADYSRIGELTSLKHLLISSTTHYLDYGIPLVDIDWIASLKNLRYLSLTYNKVSDIRAISGLTSLEELNLGWNDIADDDLEYLAGLQLKKLYLYNNDQLRDVSALAKIKSLELLHIGGNKNLSGIRGLTSLPNLKTLDISYCPNNSFLWLREFRSLETLRIQHSDYVDFYAYYDLMQCEKLHTVVISKEDTQTEQALRGLIQDFRPDIEIKYWEDNNN